MFATVSPGSERDPGASESGSPGRRAGPLSLVMILVAPPGGLLVEAPAGSVSASGALRLRWDRFRAAHRDPLVDQGCAGLHGCPKLA